MQLIPINKYTCLYVKKNPFSHVRMSPSTRDIVTDIFLLAYREPSLLDTNSHYMSISIINHLGNSLGPQLLLYKDKTLTNFNHLLKVKELF